MTTIPEQFAAAAKAHFEAQLSLITTLTSKAFEGVEQVIELNADAVKSTLGQAGDAAHTLTASSNPQEFMATAAQVQPSNESARDYARRMTSIAAGMHAEFAKAAEAQVAMTRERLAALVEEAGKNAPAGSEQAIKTMKTILQSADLAYAQLTNNARQAVETMQASIQSVSDQAGNMMDKAGKARSKS
ncbi:MAG: TIGR01841 family phasin [Janthinobacterium lividum]